jgi:hypothetical protein
LAANIGMWKGIIASINHLPTSSIRTMPWAPIYSAA